MQFRISGEFIFQRLDLVQFVAFEKLTRFNNYNNNLFCKLGSHKGLVPLIATKLVEAGQAEHENIMGKKLQHYTAHLFQFLLNDTD